MRDVLSREINMTLSKPAGARSWLQLKMPQNLRKVFFSGKHLVLL